jgi:hypothetical protein
MSCHNQQRSVEEGRSLLGGAHAMKSVKPSVDILEGLLSGVNFQCDEKCETHAMKSVKLSMPLKLSAPLRLAALEPPSKSYANRIVQSFFVQLSRNRGN